MGFIPLTHEDKKYICKEIGINDIDELFKSIPDNIKIKESFDWKSLDEIHAFDYIKKISEKNNYNMTCFMGAGIYDHFIPACIDEIISRGEFYTAYTPYQAEVSQGTLQTIFEFQSLICELTKMDVANASMYDGASALAEAVLLTSRHIKKKNFLIPENIHPYFKLVIKTYTQALDINFIDIKMHLDNGTIDIDDLKNKIDKETAGVIIQNPNFYGIIEDGFSIKELIPDRCHLIVYSDPNSLGILVPPGEYGADIVVGDCQSIGIPMSYGGPGAGFFAVREKLMRKIPGRIVGETVDVDGKKGYVLTLQTREQHIRRAKATSNICSNQALMALRSTIYLSVIGKEGLRRISYNSLQNSHYFFKVLTKIPGIKSVYKGRFYKEFLIRVPVDAKELINKIAKTGNVLFGVPLSYFYPDRKNEILIAVTEKRTIEEMEKVAKILSDIIGG